jgi:voltage-gated potassium channel
MTSIAAGLLVRSARDPGASQLAALMFASNSVDTAFSMKLPPHAGGLAYLDVLLGLKRGHGLTLIGMSRADSRKVDLNCPADCEVGPGDTLFYIADHRVGAEAVDWVAMRQVVAA